ncbi:MAG: HD domain-containing phosphohydrolase [Armatimonadota bacterium]
MKFVSLSIWLKLYVSAMILSGIGAIATTFMLPAPGLNPALLTGLVLAAIIFSTWKVELTIRQGRMTVTSAVVCVAMLLQGDLAAVLCAATGALVGTLVRTVPGKWLPDFSWREPHRGTFDLHRPLFNLANCALACSAGAHSFMATTAWMTQTFGLPDIPAKAAGIMAFQMVYFLVNTAGVSVALSLLKLQNVLQIWKDNFFWTWPSYFASASIAVGIYAAFQNPSIGILALVGLMPLYFIYYSYRLYMERMNLYVSKMEQDMRHIHELNDLNSAIIASLAMAIDAKDRHTRSHINRVQMYAVALAEAVGLDGPELEAVRIGALVHDIGKLGIPERILGKPGKLTPEEFRRMQAHVTIGAEILEPVPFPWPVKDIVLTHHERWDGLGYPVGLRAEDIPIGGRIMAIADVFDALTSNRPYRRAMSVEDALQVVREGARKQFDPTLVEVFARILPGVHGKVEELELREATREGGTSSSADGEPDWAYSQITQAAAEMSATCELAQGLAETSSVQEVLQVVIDRALRLLPTDTAVIYLCSEETGDLRAEAIGGLYVEKLSGLTMHRAEGVSGWVAETLQPQVNAQASLDIARRFNPNEVMELSAATAVPLVQGARTLGVLTLYTTGYSVLNEHHLGVLNILAEHAASALVSARRYEQTRELSLTDPLTGLPNSRSLIHHMETLCQPWSGVPQGHITDQFAVLMFDLDGFKNVNDTLGHLRGDEVLKQFGEILRTMSRDQDLPCRYAGDEFVVVLGGAEQEAARQFARRVRNALERSTRGTLPTALGVSIGSACFPHDGQDVRNLLAVADQRMYNDKFSRRSPLSLE